jgi:cell division protein FtsW
MAQRLKTDWVLFFTILGMVCFGLVMVYSASSGMKNPLFYVEKQFGWAVGSFLLLLYCTKKDYRRWNDPQYAFAVLGLVLLMLLVVYFADGGSHRWLKVAGVSLQPSEFAKPALALFLSFFLTRRLGAINDKHTLLPVAFSICAIAFFVAVADLGTAVVLVVTTIVVMFVAGLDYRYLAVTVALGVLMGGAFIVKEPYRLSRAIDFLDPLHTLLNKLDPSGRILTYSKSSLSTRDTKYQQHQAEIAVGSGGLTGRGLMLGRQKNGFLPEANTDMIYAAIGEETGFVGCFVLVLGFGVILWRGIRLYWNAADDFGKYLALSVTVSVVVQAFINISVVLNLGPAKGIPLPLISYGGSSLMSTLLLMGMLLSVSEHASNGNT